MSAQDGDRSSVAMTVDVGGQEHLEQIVSDGAVFHIDVLDTNAISSFRHIVEFGIFP